LPDGGISGRVQNGDEIVDASEAVATGLLRVARAESVAPDAAGLAVGGVVEAEDGDIEGPLKLTYQRLRVKIVSGQVDRRLVALPKGKRIGSGIFYDYAVVRGDFNTCLRGDGAIGHVSRLNESRR
jgi:hypothetical protein